MTNQEAGEGLVREAQRISERDLTSAWRDRDYNLMPLETLEEIRRISAWLSEARAPAFYLERVYGEGDARRALTEAEFVLASVRKAFGMVSE